MARPDNRPANRPDDDPPDDYRLSRAGHQPGREPADPAVIALAAWLAGDGDLDDRCARILAVFRHVWWPDPEQD